jgi:hypothetical protein
VRPLEEAPAWFRLEEELLVWYPPLVEELATYGQYVHLPDDHSQGQPVVLVDQNLDLLEE